MLGDVTAVITPIRARVISANVCILTLWRSHWTVSHDESDKSDKLDKRCMCNNTGIKNIKTLFIRYQLLKHLLAEPALEAHQRNTIAKQFW